MPTAAIVLLVEDDRMIAESTGSYLESLGFEVDYARDGAEGLRLASENRYDAILMDGNLPRLDGLEVVRKLRGEARVSTPILMVTGRDTLEHKVEGLEMGVDDYLTKPFAAQELEARLRAIIRRNRKEVATQILQVGDLSFDPMSHILKRGDRRIELSPVGSRLLKILMRESPRVVSRKEIERELWGDELPDSDALRSHIYNLRKNVDKGFGRPLLHTVQSSGYRLADIDSPLEREQGPLSAVA